MRIYIYIAIIIFFTNCKKSTTQSTINFEGLEIIKSESGFILKMDSSLLGVLSLNNSKNIIFRPFSDSSTQINLNKNGVGFIGHFYNQNPNGPVLFFDEYSLPSRIVWFNNGKMYSEITNLESERGSVQRSILENVDSNIITLPEVFITKSEKIKDRYRFTVYSTTYPIYLMGVYYNIDAKELGEYNFINNSFSLLFDKKEMNSDTLKLEFKYYEDFVEHKDKHKHLIKTLSFEKVLDFDIAM